MTVKELASSIIQHFEQIERQPSTGTGEAERIWARKDNSPDWVLDLCRYAHNGMFPDDYKYYCIVEMLDLLADGVGYDELPEHIEPDVYTVDRLDWLRNNYGYRKDYCDDADNEFGKANTIEDSIGQGQLMEKTEVYNLVKTFLEERLDSLDDEEHTNE